MHAFSLFAPFTYAIFFFAKNTQIIIEDIYYKEEFSMITLLVWFFIAVGIVMSLAVLAGFVVIFAGIFDLVLDIVTCIAPFILIYWLIKWIKRGKRS